MNEVLRFFTEYSGALANESTRMSYNAFVCSFTKFLGGRDITFDDIDLALTTEYQQWMIKSGRTQKYIIRLGKHFRKLYRSAVKDGKARANDEAFVWVKNVTEPGKEIKSTKCRPDTLIMLRELLNEDLSEKKPLERVRDLFLFAVLCGGLTFADMYNLKNSSVADGRLSLECDGSLRVIKLSPLALQLLANLRRADVSDDAYLLPCYQDSLAVEDALHQWGKGLEMVFSMALVKQYELTDGLTAQLCVAAMRDAGVGIDAIKSALCHVPNTSLSSLSHAEVSHREIARAYDSLSNAISDVRKRWYAVSMVLDFTKFEQLLKDEGIYAYVELYYPMAVIEKYDQKRSADKQNTVLKRILFVRTTDAKIVELSSSIRTNGYVYRNPVGCRNKYAVISDRVMKEFRLLLSHGEDFEPEDFAENNNFKPNDSVTITEDCFAGKDAIIIHKVGKDKYLVKILNAAFSVKYTVSKAFIRKK